MSEGSYSTLIKRIRERCQRRDDADRGYQDAFGREYWYDENGQEFIAFSEDESSEPHFAYPHATERQISETESLLGFPLPPLLRLLYTQVANGGFGPGYGVIGAVGGFPLDDGMGKDIAHGYLKDIEGCRLIQLNEFEMMTMAQRYHELKKLPADSVLGWLKEPLQLSKYTIKPEWEHTYLYEFPHGIWPDRLLPLCYWGCGICSCIDARTENIFQVSASSRGWHYILVYSAASLEEWFERWLAGESLQLL